jgi:hypothetical protein
MAFSRVLFCVQTFPEQTETDGLFVDTEKSRLAIESCILSFKKVELRPLFWTLKDGEKMREGDFQLIFKSSKGYKCLHYASM